MCIYPNRIYRHFKGKYYLVIGVAVDANSGKHRVVYRALYDDCRLFVRPLEEFLSPVDTEKYPDANQKYRFELSSLVTKEE